MRVAILLACAVCITERASASQRILSLRQRGEPALLLTPAIKKFHPRYATIRSFKHFSDEVLFGKEGPLPNDARQGFIGDCYLIAVLSGLADVDPQRVQNLFARNADGSLALDESGRAQVVFHRLVKLGHYEADRVPITAKFLLDKKGRPVFAKVVDAKLWVAAVEKAFAVWNDRLDKDDAYDSQYYVVPRDKRGWDRIESGYALHVLEALSGAPSTLRTLNANEQQTNQTFAAIRQALTSHRVVAAVSVNRASLERVNLAAAHVYSVHRVFEVDGTKYIQLRDPSNRRQRRFRLSLEDFAARFDQVAIEGTVATN